MAKKRQDNQPAETAKPVKQTPKPQKPQRAASSLPWHPALRLLVSLLVLFHLLAVFVAPWDLATSEAYPPGYMPPTDSLGRPQRPDVNVIQQPIVSRFLRRNRVIRNYLNLLYLNHGYEFFAPDPAGTHVIDYKVSQADGSLIEGRFPSLKEQWPRLLYHRHMMLADQLVMINDELMRIAEATGSRIPFAGQMYAEHLATLYGGQANLDLRIHILLSQQQVLDGLAPDDPSTYRLMNTVSGNPRPKRNTTDAGSTGSEAPIVIPGASQ